MFLKAKGSDMDILYKFFLLPPLYLNKVCNTQYFWFTPNKKSFQLTCELRYSPCTCSELTYEQCLENSKYFDIAYGYN